MIMLLFISVRWIKNLKVVTGQILHTENNCNLFYSPIIFRPGSSCQLPCLRDEGDFQIKDLLRFTELHGDHMYLTVTEEM